MERTNSISGRKYRDDATIFAWDLVNEPRCETWRVSAKLLPDLKRAAGSSGSPAPKLILQGVNPWKSIYGRDQMTGKPVCRIVAAGAGV